MGIKPDRELIERIDEDLKRIIAEHRPAPLPADILTALNDIQARFESSHAPR
jgi:hypothetical protein